MAMAAAMVVIGDYGIMALDPIVGPALVVHLAVTAVVTAGTATLAVDLNTKPFRDAFGSPIRSPNKFLVL
jgi:hypothetical protein